MYLCQWVHELDLFERRADDPEFPLRADGRPSLGADRCAEMRPLVQAFSESG